MIQIHLGDYRDWIKTIEPGSVSVVINDPPFGTGFDYGEGQYKDDLDSTAYQQFTSDWLNAAYRILKPDWALWIAMGDEHVADVKIQADNLFTMRNWCIQHYNFGTHQNKKFGRNKVHLLYFVKDAKKFTFNADDIRFPSLRQTKYKDKSANSKGRVPGDVLDYARLPGNAKERTGHPCQTSEKVIERIILATSNRGELVVDLFGGSFSTASVCKKLGRDCISGDISPEFVESGKKRLANIPTPLAGLFDDDTVNQDGEVADQEVRILNV